MKKICLCAFLLAGCGTGMQTVQVPVSSCPAPAVLVMPELAVSRLPQKPDTSASLKAIAEDHITLKGELERCITILDGYRK